MQGSSSRLWTQVVFLAALIAVVAVYFYFAYYATDETKVVSGTETKEVVKAPAPVVVAPVERGDVTREIVVVGTIDAEYRLQVLPETGGRLLSLDVEEGSAVKAGDAVAVVEHELADLQVEQARTGLEMAGIFVRKAVLEAQRAQAEAGLSAAKAGRDQVKTRRRNLEKERDRIRKLHESGAVSESNLDSVETSLASIADQEALAEAQVSQAEAALALLEAQLEDLASARKRQAETALALALLQKEKAAVKAPRNGIVNRKYVEVGDLVGPARSLFEIVGMDRVKVAVDLPETVFGRIKEGETRAEIAVDAWPDREPFTGIITRIGPSLNPASRALPVEILIENPGHLLRPGMSAKVRVMPEAAGGVLKVPLEAVVRENGDRFVFVLGPDEKSVRKTAVRTGLSSDRETEVLGGLEPGDLVVVRGTVGLSDGSAVTLLAERD